MNNMAIDTSWLQGLFKLVHGAQTDPRGTAMRAAMSGVDPSAVEQVLQLGGVAAAPRMAPGAQTSGWDSMIYGQQVPFRQGAPLAAGFSVAKPTGSIPPNTHTMPQIGVTAPMLPERRGSPLLSKAGSWTVMDPATVPPEAFRVSPAPGLTPEQIAKLASMIPGGQVASGGGGGGGGGFAPRPVQMGQLSVDQRAQRPGLADILRGGR